MSCSVRKLQVRLAVRIWLGCAITLILCASRAGAHALEQGIVFLNIGDSSVSGRIEINIGDLNQALSLELATDQSVTMGEIEPYVEQIKRYLRGRLTISAAGSTALMKLAEHELISIPLAQYFVIYFSFPELNALPDHLDFDYRILSDVDPQHRGFVVIENNWQTGTFDNEGMVSLILGPDQPRQRLDLSASSFANGFWAMTKLGMHHIWVGIDHVLFLLALLLTAVVRRTQSDWVPAENFRTALLYVVKIVTLFTLAHTVTLSAATLGALSLPSRVVESVIALSIAIVALDILRPFFHRRIWWVVFAFGLFHGFGFASVLSGIDIPPKFMVWSLLAFNLGVELGQILIVCIAFPILYQMRGVELYRRGGLQLGACLLLVISLYWFIERGFEIDLPAGEYLNRVLAVLGLRE
jgi:hypothetical protein